MTSKTLKLFDSISATALLVWLGFAIAYLIFRPTITIFVTDIGAWCAFGIAMLLSGLPRWLHCIKDAEVIGLFRLWAAAGIMALVFCTASSFVATPKIEELQARATAQASATDQDALFRALSKTQNFSMQFLCIRAILALAMALGARKLPQNGSA
jgi:hypothetical protein